MSLAMIRIKGTEPSNSKATELYPNLFESPISTQLTKSMPDLSKSYPVRSQTPQWFIDIDIYNHHV